MKAIQAHDSRDVGQSLLPGSPLRSTSMDEGVERVVRKPSVLLTNQVETKRPFQKAGGSNSPIKHSAPSTPNTSTTASKSPASTAIREADELILPELHVIPRPGYVIKTRRASNNPTQEEEKVFINVYHHESIVDKKLALHEVASPTTSVHDAKDNTTSLFILPKLYLGVATDTKDKEGNLSSLYNVVISSDYFAKDAVEEKKSTDVSVVQKVRWQFALYCFIFLCSC